MKILIRRRMILHKMEINPQPEDADHVLRKGVASPVGSRYASFTDILKSTAAEKNHPFNPKATEITITSDTQTDRFKVIINDRFNPDPTNDENISRSKTDRKVFKRTLSRDGRKVIKSRILLSRGGKTTKDDRINLFKIGKTTLTEDPIRLSMDGRTTNDDLPIRGGRKVNRPTSPNSLDPNALTIALTIIVTIIIFDPEHPTAEAANTMIIRDISHSSGNNVPSPDTLHTGKTDATDSSLTALMPSTAIRSSLSTRKLLRIPMSLSA
jgi:hypothetical protein